MAWNSLSIAQIDRYTKTIDARLQQYLPEHQDSPDVFS